MEKGEEECMGGGGGERGGGVGDGGAKYRIERVFIHCLIFTVHTVDVTSSKVCDSRLLSP